MQTEAQTEAEREQELKEEQAMISIMPILRQTNPHLSEAELKELGKDIYQKPETNLRKIIGSFTANYDGNFYIDGHEVEAIKFFSMEEIRKMVKNGEKFHPEFLFLLEKYFS